MSGSHGLSARRAWRTLSSRPEGPQPRSRGPEGPQTSICSYCHIVPSPPLTPSEPIHFYRLHYTGATLSLLPSYLLNIQVTRAQQIWSSFSKKISFKIQSKWWKIDKYLNIQVTRAQQVFSTFSGFKSQANGENNWKYLCIKGSSSDKEIKPLGDLWMIQGGVQYSLWTLAMYPRCIQAGMMSQGNCNIHCEL